MKRPLFIIAVIVLSGLVCGIKEASFMIRIPAVAVMAWLGMMIKSGISKKDAPLFLLQKITTDERKAFLLYRLLLMTIVLLLFCLGAVRGYTVSRKYNSQECTAFYEPYRATNPGQFDYALYLKGRGICSAESYEKMQNGDPDAPPLFVLLTAIRDQCEGIYDHTLSEHDAGIYKAVVLGNKAEMDMSVRDLYQDAGIAHLLAVSGLHVSLIGTALFELLRRKWKKRTAAVIVSVVMFLYMLMTGASGSTVRAVIMLFFGFAAALLGRTYDMRSALSLSAIVIMLQHPYQIFSAAFQMSFGAVGGISFLGETMIHRLELLLENSGEPDRSRRKKRVFVRSRFPKLLKVFFTSISIQMFLLPVMAYHYFVFPIYGILLNFAVIPLMGVVVLSGLGVLGTGMLVSVFRFPVLMAAAPGHYILQMYEFLAAWSMKLPYASVCVGRPEMWQILLYYCLLAAVLFGATSGMIRKKIHIAYRILILLTGFLLVSNVLKYHDFHRTSVAMLDVGQGDGLVIRNGDFCALVDCGSSSNKRVGERILEPYLLSQGITKLDMVIVSHSDQDHINGLMYLFEQSGHIRAERLVLPGPARQNEEYAKAAETFAADEVYYLEDGTLIARKGDFSLKCIYAGREDAERNRHSAVLLMEKKGFRMLFTGDATAEDEAVFSAWLRESELTAAEKLSVLKVSHHGSNTATTEELLEAYRPDIALISCGKKNRYGHPHKEVLERLSAYGVRVVQTQNEGYVKIVP